MENGGRAGWAVVTGDNANAYVLRLEEQPDGRIGLKAAEKPINPKGTVILPENPRKALRPIGYVAIQRARGATNVPLGDGTLLNAIPINGTHTGNTQTKTPAVELCIQQPAK